MSSVNYKICGYSKVPFEGEINSLQLVDRTKFLRIYDSSFTLEIDFPACVIDQIQIGLMNSSKVMIFGRHKMQNNRKLMIEKVENVDKELRAVVYHSNNFKNFKRSELTNLNFSFTNREKSACISLNYIIILKSQEPSKLLSPKHSKPLKSKYEFIDQDNTRLDFHSHQTEAFKDPDYLKSIPKEKSILRSPEKPSYSPRPITSSHSFSGTSSSRPGSWTTSQFYKPEKEEKLIHNNSYAGICSGIIVWLRVSGSHFEIYNEICEVLGIAVLEQPEELVDYFLCDEADEEVEQLSRVFEKKVLRIEWILDCVEKKVKSGVNDFLISFND